MKSIDEIFENMEEYDPNKRSGVIYTTNIDSEFIYQYQYNKMPKTIKIPEISAQDKVCLAMTYDYRYYTIS